MIKEYRLSRRSMERLKNIHPLLSACVCRAIVISNVDFTVIEGERSKERQEQLYAQGRTEPGNIVTWTLNSKHIVQSDGFSHAVDLAPFVNGKIRWDNNLDFYAIKNAMFRAASDIRAELAWGGYWKSPDMPHFEIVI